MDDLEEMQRQLVEAKKAVAVAIADEKWLQKQYAAETEKARGWEQTALSAARDGNADVAREASAREQEHTVIAAQYRKQWTAQKESVERLELALREVSNRLDETRRNRVVETRPTLVVEATNTKLGDVPSIIAATALERIVELDAPDAIARMLALPPFYDRPRWARFDHDAAIGNLVAAIVRGDRVAAARVGLCAAHCAHVVLGPGTHPLDINIAIALSVMNIWIRLPREPMRKRLAVSEARRHLFDSEQDDIARMWLRDAADYTAATTDGSSTNASLAAICAVRCLVAHGRPVDTSVIEIARAVVANELPPDDF